MEPEKKYYHWFWGDNNIRLDTPNYLANMELGVVIRFDYSKGMFSDFEDFYRDVADVQFVFGSRPSNEKVDEILTEAFNYLAIEERILDADLDDDDYM